jgi:hypothetical protein
MRTSLYTSDEPEIYYGPSGPVGGMTLAGATGEFEIGPCCGYLHQLEYGLTAAVNMDITFKNSSLETLYAKTGLSTGSGNIARPRVLEQKNTDGTDLTTRTRFWLNNEMVTVSIANATAGDIVEAFLTILPA